MAVNITDIKSIWTYYKTELYGGVRDEQTIDKSYYEDSFAVPEIAGFFSNNIRL